MSSWPKLFAIATVIASVSASAAEPQRYGFGTTPTKAQIDGWAIAVRPDGQGLPQGSGSVADGDELYANVCAS